MVTPKLTSIPISNTLSASKYGVATVVNGDFLYGFGGIDNVGALRSIEGYKISQETGLLTNLAGLPALNRRMQYTAAVSNGDYIYCIGGHQTQPITFTGPATIVYNSVHKLFGSNCYVGQLSYLTTPVNIDYAFKSDLWTVEFFVLFYSFPSGSSHCMFFMGVDTAGTPQLSISITSSPALNVTVRGSTTISATGTSFTPSTNTWYHIVVQRCSDDTIRCWKDGVLNCSMSVAGSLAVPTQPISIGARYYNGTASLGMNGIMANFRMSNIARYPNTSNITIPTAFFTDDNYTTLLLFTNTSSIVNTSSNPARIQGYNVNQLTGDLTRLSIDLPIIASDQSLTSYYTGCSAISHGNYIYVIGGYTGSIAKDNIYCYEVNQSTGELILIPIVGHLTTAMAYANAICINNNILLFGGHTGTVGSTIIQGVTINPLSHYVTTNTSLPSLSVARYLTAVGYDSQIHSDNYDIYMLGGYTTGTTTNIYSYLYESEVGIYEPDGYLTPFAIDKTLSISRTYASSATVGNYIYIFNQTTIDGYYVNPVSGELTTLINLPTLPLYIVAGASAVINNDVYLIGGSSNGGTSEVIIKFTVNLTTGELSIPSILPMHLNSPRTLAAAASVGNYLYVFGGQYTGALSTIEGFYINPSTGAFTRLTGLPTLSAESGKTSMSAISVSNYIYLFGGGNGVSTIEGFSVNISNGVLTPLTGEPALSQNITSAAICNIDNYIYIIGGTDINTIEWFSINTSNGVLTPMLCNQTLLSQYNSSRSAVSIYNKYVYFFGNSSNGKAISGFSSTEFYNDIPLLTQQTLTTGVTALETARSHFNAALHNHSMYIIGGYALSNSILCYKSHEGMLFTATSNNVNWGTLSPYGITTVYRDEDQEYIITPKKALVAKVIDDEIQSDFELSYTFKNIQSPHTIYTKFSKPYRVIITTSYGGTITNDAIQYIELGSNVSYTITPFTGHEIYRILIDGEDITVTNRSIQTYSFINVTANHSIHVIFNEKLKLVATSSINGSISPNGITYVSNFL